MFLVADLENDELVGAATLERKQGSRRFYLGYWIAPRFWGQGLATEACRPLVEYAQFQLKLGELFAAVAPHNAASQKVLSKLKFEAFSTEERENTRAGHQRMLLYRRDLG
jgi:RimJ/RimL family protein N-acetyltransferase